MSPAEFLSAFQEVIASVGGVRAYARKTGINQATVSRVANGHQRPTEAILRRLGYVEKTEYIKVRKP